jgi:cytochrome c biogenesis protein CcdA
MSGTERSVRQDNSADARSLGQLFSSASKDMSTLVRNEIELAKRELKVDAVEAAKGSGALIAAAFVGLFAFIFLSFALVYGIHWAGLNLFWSFLIVGGLYLLIVALLALFGIKSFKKIRPPERTIKTAKDTMTTLKGRG